MDTLLNTYLYLISLSVLFFAVLIGYSSLERIQELGSGSGSEMMHQVHA